jgi:hypothetical protein
MFKEEAENILSCKEYEIEIQQMWS